MRNQQAPRRKLSEITADDLPKVNTVVTIFTYAVLIAYCCICANQDHGLFAGVELSDEELLLVLQLFSDSIYPTTVTLAVSLLVQCFIEFAKLKEFPSLLSFIALCAVIFYTALYMASRKIDGILHFIVMLVFTIALVILCMKAIPRHRMEHPGTPTGVSRVSAPPPGNR